MNSAKVEAIYRRYRDRKIFPGESGYNYPRRTLALDRHANVMAIYWGARKAEHLAASQCFDWAKSFLIWTIDIYHPGAFGDEFCIENQIHELRILRAANCMGTWGAPDPFAGWGCSEFAWLVALSTDQLKLIEDAFARNRDPYDALFPSRRRRKSNQIGLMAAAHAIAKTCKP